MSLTKVIELTELIQNCLTVRFCGRPFRKASEGDVWILMKDHAYTDSTKQLSVSLNQAFIEV